GFGCFVCVLVESDRHFGSEIVYTNRPGFFIYLQNLDAAFALALCEHKRLFTLLLFSRLGGRLHFQEGELATHRGDAAQNDSGNWRRNHLLSLNLWLVQSKKISCRDLFVIIR